MQDKYTLKGLHELMNVHYVYPDEGALALAIITIAGNSMIERNPIWVLHVAPSSGGKTTLIDILSQLKVCHRVDEMTPNTFLSGYNVGNKQASLLKVIGNGILVVSDLTAILSKEGYAPEIMSQFRMIYDGSFSKGTGKGTIDWKGKMGFIGACTPAVYDYLDKYKAMGERFLYYQIFQPSREAIAKKIAESTMSDKQKSEDLQVYVFNYYESLKAFRKNFGDPKEKLELTEEQQKRLNYAATFSVFAKATVKTDFKTGMVCGIPNIAGTGRDLNMMKAILEACLLLEAHDSENMMLSTIDNKWLDMIEKMAYSSIPTERRRILEILAYAKEPLKASEIGVLRKLGFEKEMVEKVLNVLLAVGTVGKIVGGSGVANKWFIEDPQAKKFITDNAPRIEDQSVYDAKDDDEKLKELKEEEENRKAEQAKQEDDWFNEFSLPDVEVETDPTLEF